MNWGKGLVIGLIAFMSYITILAIKMLNSNEDSFDKDYYEKGLAYNTEYTQKQQVKIDHAEPIINYNDDVLTINFKTTGSGEIDFKRPSSKTEDKLIKFTGNEVTILRKELLTGEWKVIIHWTNKHKTYLYEQSIYLP
ncbi:FixH family protein [Pelobium sp.]|nr:FixH family protein [Pelobium sp.]MDA9555449.1 FixH family protein [Pelobium sp.]